MWYSEERDGGRPAAGLAGDRERSKPVVRPRRALFSSGPCAKHPGWDLDRLRGALLGRSHRSRDCKARLELAIDLTREVLEVPPTHRIAIVPGSDTGALEMAMWSMLGARGVHVLAWEAFGLEWVKDAVSQLRLRAIQTSVSPYGELPDLSRIDFSNDVVFTWNGTAAGVRVPSADFIPEDRGGLTICDATSAAFAVPLDWSKLDVVTFSWQKVLGGEGAHGMLVLGPRAADRLKTHVPPWPIPKVFRLSDKGELLEGLFRGETINTPSMLCIEDYLSSLRWAQEVGGLAGLHERTRVNAAVLDGWVSRTGWVDHLAQDPNTRSLTGVCLSIVAWEFTSLCAEGQAAFVRDLTVLLEAEGVAFDIGSYRDAPPGLRVWCGATVDAADLQDLTGWLDWGFAETSARLVHPIESHRAG